MASITVFWRAMKISKQILCSDASSRIRRSEIRSMLPIPLPACRSGLRQLVSFHSVSQQPNNICIHFCNFNLILTLIKRAKNLGLNYDLSKWKESLLSEFYASRKASLMTDVRLDRLLPLKAREMCGKKLVWCEADNLSSALWNCQKAVSATKLGCELCDGIDIDFEFGGTLY